MALKYAVNDVDILNNCVSWYPLNEFSSAAGAVTRYDAQGGNDLTDVNTVASTAGGWNRAALFTRANSEYFSRSLGSTGLELATSFSVSFVIDYTSTSTPAQSIYQSGTATNFWVIQSVSGKIYFTEDNIADYISTGTLTAGVRNTVTITKNGDGANNLLIYINGSLDSTHSVGSVVTPSGTAYVGTFNTGTASRFLDATLQDLHVHSVALTSAQISRLHNAGDGMTYGIDFDNATAIANWSTSNPATASHTTTGENRYLQVSVFTNAAVTAMTATYGGVSMNQLSVIVDPDGNKNFVFYLKNPLVGSNTVSVTRTGGSNMSITAASYIGTDQTTPIVDSVTDAGVNSTTFTSSAVTATADNWLLSTFRNTDSATLTSSDVLKRVATTTVLEEAWDSNKAVAAGSQTVTYTISPSARLYGHTLVAIAPVAVAGASSIKSINGVLKADIKSFNGVTLL